MQTRLRWLVLALCGLAAASPATAQETGSISGYTFDATGTAVAGVTITVTGPQLPGTRTVTTSDNGFFQVPILLPGSYTVKASKAGVGDSQRTVGPGQHLLGRGRRVSGEAGLLARRQQLTAISISISISISN